MEYPRIFFKIKNYTIIAALKFHYLKLVYFNFHMIPFQHQGPLYFGYSFLLNIQIIYYLFKAYYNLL